ncbi:C6 transcription factor [Blastomyces gilchristii SLH14081]|uniref:C6 transcription factor n=1 Tax=Blastomyces gilchristii (strain SLH14081) TaxID=559298 RepID=A0A179UZ81_BLAGS|nr:C6 transcription factor [Blastomyces gilchristii SLH14081]OAT13143.1 C6 transcription factor [Blastomyces gilchristii SLH14081]
MDQSAHKILRAQGQPQNYPLNIFNLPNYSNFPNTFIEPTETANRTMSSSSPTRADSKIAIPRLRRPGQNQPSPASERHRVSHACDPCRKRKSKCDGLRPVCSRCRDQEIACAYLDGKREKMKRYTKSNAAKVTVYEKLLYDILPHLKPEMQLTVRTTLLECRNLAEDDNSTPIEATGSGDEDEYAASAGAGSPRFQDRIQPDSAGFVITTGFLGKSSVTRWIEELATKLLKYFGPTSEDILNGERIFASFDEFYKCVLKECTYFLDDEYLEKFLVVRKTGNSPPKMFKKIDNQSEPLQKEMADIFLNSYFLTVHPMFPILSEEEFRVHYEIYYQTAIYPSHVWRNILHVVFAIGALHALRIQVPCSVVENDHVMYAFRSGALGRSSTHLGDIPSMEELQLAAISGLYYLTSHHINRAWNVIGLAVRFAQTRALHLVNTSTELSEGEREFELRVWHSISSMERFLCVLTGRPSSLQDRFTSARLPRPMDFPSTGPLAYNASRAAMAAMYPPSNTTPVTSSAIPPWTIFVRCLRLDLIIAEALEELYSPSTVNRTWAGVQNLVLDLDKKLAQWRDDLPHRILDLSPASKGLPPLDQRMYLNLRFYGACILINRPCFCEAQQLRDAIPSQSATSKRMDEDAAISCLSAARNIIDLLPQDIQPAKLYLATPWWCVLHYIVQAGTVLVMELSMDVSHLPNETENLIKESTCVLRWLQALSVTNEPAHRAHVSLSRLMFLALAKLGKDNHNPARQFMAKDTSVSPSSPTSAISVSPQPFMPNPVSAGWQD